MTQACSFLSRSEWKIIERQKLQEGLLFYETRLQDELQRFYNDQDQEGSKKRHRLNPENY